MAKYAAALRSSGEVTKSFDVLRKAQLVVRPNSNLHPADSLPERSVLSCIDRTMGDNFVFRSEWTKAASSFQTAVAQLPTNSTAHYGHGLVLQERKKYDEAVQHHLWAIALDPDFHNPLVALGECWVQMGYFERAAEACRHCLHLQPDYAVAKFCLGQAIYGQLQSGTWQDGDAKAKQLRDEGCLAFKSAKAWLPDHWKEADADLLRCLENGRLDALPKKDFESWRCIRLRS